jgi:hypothetical protein
MAIRRFVSSWAGISSTGSKYGLALALLPLASVLVVPTQGVAGIFDSVPPSGAAYREQFLNDGVAEPYGDPNTPCGLIANFLNATRWKLM